MKVSAPRSHIKPDVQKAALKLIYILFVYILFVNKIIYINGLIHKLKTKQQKQLSVFKIRLSHCQSSFPSNDQKQSIGGIL